MEPDHPDSGPLASRLRMIEYGAERDFAALHQYLHVVTRETQRSFDVVADRVRNELDPESHDEGDVYWYAAKKYGADPLEVWAHTGLMLLSRAVALSEVIFAAIPDELLTNAESIVYNGDHSWSRKMAVLFYKTCLARPVDISAGPIAPITDLRDLYAHGYGRPHRDEEAARIAAALHPHLGAVGLTDEESDLGFDEDPYAFGPWSRFHPATGLESGLLSPVVAELSPVATRRLLRLVEDRVHEVLLAASWGIKKPLTEENSAFVKAWVKEEALRLQEHEERANRQKQKAREKEARREEIAAQIQRDRAEGLARQAKQHRERQERRAPDTTAVDDENAAP